MAIFLLLAAIGVSWYFSRPQADPQRALEGATADSPSRTKAAERSAPGPAMERSRQEAISTAAQKWYEELLVKYPQMKPSYREVPDERNGFLQWAPKSRTLSCPEGVEGQDPIKLR
jgi:hypothetical protein